MSTPVEALTLRRQQIADADGNVEAAAAAAGVQRETFFDWLREHGLNPNDFKK